MDQRREFVRLAMQEEANRRELCRRFGIHPIPATSGLAAGLAAIGSFAIARAGRIRAPLAASRQWKLSC